MSTSSDIESAQRAIISRLDESWFLLVFERLEVAVRRFVPHRSFDRVRACMGAVNPFVVTVVLVGSALFAAVAQGHVGGRAVSRDVLPITASQLPTWYHTPLTAKQLKSEVPVPSDPAKVTGKLRLTTADYRDDAGGLAINPSEAVGTKVAPQIPRVADPRTLVALEALQLAGDSVFSFGGDTPSKTTATQLKKLSSALQYVTGATCEGYSSYGAESAKAYFELGLTRAKAICALLHQQYPNIVVKSVSYGATRPAVVGGTIAQRAIDRRVVIVITGATASVPPAPVVASTAADASASLSITPASATPAITDYQYSLDGGKTWAGLGWEEGDPIHGVVTGLTNGTAYSIIVRAENSAGYSDPSAPTTGVPFAATVPDAPVITQNGEVDQEPTALNLQSFITFGVASTGNSPITGWLYSLSGGPYHSMSVSPSAGGMYRGEVDWEDESPCAPYSLTVQVEAVNAVGTSPASNSWQISETPFGCSV